MQGSHMAYSVASDVMSFRVCYRFRIVRAVLYPRPIPPFCHGKYMVSICVSTVFQCDGAGWVVAAHRVVMDTLRFRLSCTRGSTLLVGTIPQAHLLLMSLTLKYEHYKDVYSYNQHNFFTLHRKIVWIQEIPYPSQGRLLHQFGLPHASGNSNFNLASKYKGIQPIFFQIG